MTFEKRLSEQAAAIDARLAGELAARTPPQRVPERLAEHIGNIDRADRGAREDAPGKRSRAPGMHDRKHGHKSARQGEHVRHEAHPEKDVPGR